MPVLILLHRLAMGMHVCITIDTEYSIGGAFADASLLPIADPMVWCNVDGRSEGLGHLLKCFSQYRIPATFFVEALHRYYFKDDPMRPIVRRIEDDGHELQLHAHPCWSVFQHEDWRERVRQQPRQDDFFGRSEDDSVHLIEQGIETFKSWGLARPTVFRSGSLQHDDHLYRALARTRMPYSSNVGLAIFDSGDPDYRMYSGIHERHGVLECPVLTFNDWSVGGRRHLKSLTIAGTSFAETRTLLDKAERAGIPLVVILTHPFEYIQSRDIGRAPARRHHVNQQRLASLCQYLDQNRDRFIPSGMAGAAAVARASAAQGEAGNLLLEGMLWQSVRRMATQVVYDKFGNLALAAA
jgi:peptidoglycan/xylan/chitin deacetylase (PgdA/CDA1 family)